jgi:hypothetical protein
VLNRTGKAEKEYPKRYQKSHFETKNRKEGSAQNNSEI